MIKEMRNIDDLLNNIAVSLFILVMFEFMLLIGLAMFKELLK